MITVVNGHIVVSTYANAQGDFLLSAVPNGVYTVNIQAD